MTISRDGAKWFVAIQVQYEAPDVVHPNQVPIGLDLGIKHFAVLSDRTVIAPLNSFRTLACELAAAQVNLSRKRKFGRNWSRQKALVSAVHRRIANCRREFLHQTSNRITNNHGDIRLEALKAKNMSASAAGSLLEPGVNVSAKRGLNKSILDQGWYEFRRQLEYKSKWKGGKVSLVNPQHTSQECPECHHIEAGNRPTRDQFCCLKCGYRDEADYVAARNISQRDTLLEPVQRTQRKLSPTKPSREGCRGRNPSVKAVLIPLPEPGITVPLGR